MIAVVVLAAAVAAVVLVVIRVTGTNRHGARVVDFTIDSPLLHRKLPAVGVVPPGNGGAGRPLLVFLHGSGGDQNSSLTSQMFAALAAQGTGAPDVVFPDGGSDSYWHNRATGAWETYVLAEVIPRAIALLHADRRRVAIGGISMGGFGALDIARLHPHRFCAVGGHSAAVFFTSTAAAHGAFDDAKDFSRNNLIALAKRSNPYGSTPVWLDVGNSDPFRPADTALAHQLNAHGARLTFSHGPGGHAVSYWNGRWDDYLRFYSRALRHCRT